MKISILTLFPDQFTPILSTSILGRATKKGLVEYEIIDLRKFGQGKHRSVDDRPFGGGPGMILRADVLLQAFKSIQPLAIRHQQAVTSGYKPYTILMSPSGTTFKQAKAKQFSKLDHLVIVCGHYEGVDQRFIDQSVDEEISIGDYVLTGGEIPAMAIIDSVTRLVPGVLEKPESTTNESFADYKLQTTNYKLLEYPQYTRPEVFDGSRVPKVLLSGNHQEIAKWRKLESIKKTKKKRPDLLKGVKFS